MSVLIRGRRSQTTMDDYDAICYECGGYGDDYYFDDDGELVCACDDCWVTRMREEDKDHVVYGDGYLR